MLSSVIAGTSDVRNFNWRYALSSQLLNGVHPASLFGDGFSLCERKSRILMTPEFISPILSLAFSSMRREVHERDGFECFFAIISSVRNDDWTTLITECENAAGLILPEHIQDGNRHGEVEVVDVSNDCQRPTVLVHVFLHDAVASGRCNEVVLCDLSMNVRHLFHPFADCLKDPTVLILSYYDAKVKYRSSTKLVCISPSSH